MGTSSLKLSRQNVEMQSLMAIAQISQELLSEDHQISQPYERAMPHEVF